MSRVEYFQNKIAIHAFNHAEWMEERSKRSYNDSLKTPAQKKFEAKLAVAVRSCQLKRKTTDYTLDIMKVAQYAQKLGT